MDQTKIHVLSPLMGYQKLVQYKFPKSKKKRIRKKWEKNIDNFKSVEVDLNPNDLDPDCYSCGYISLHGFDICDCGKCLGCCDACDFCGECDYCNCESDFFEDEYKPFQ